MAADRGVKVYTVGIGTTSGELIGAEGWSMRVRLDEASLKTIANLTQGEYFYAGTANDLKKVYESLNSKLVMEKRETEITALFAAAAAVDRHHRGVSFAAVVQPDSVSGAAGRASSSAFFCAATGPVETAASSASAAPAALSFG